MHDLDDYVPVAERIALFYERFATGRIRTRLVERSADVVIVQASVYRSETDRQPSATGWAAERPGDGEVNTVACLENAETSAIGRALANLGLDARRRHAPHQGSSRPTRDSVSKRESSVSLESLGVRTIYGHPLRRAARPPSSDLAPPPAPAAVSAATEEPRPLSLIARDLIRLLHEAERQGLRPRRTTAWKVRIETRCCADADLARLEAALRAWVWKARERNVERDAREL